MRKTRPSGSTQQHNPAASVYGGHRFSLIAELGAAAALLIVALIAVNGWHVWHTYHLALERSRANTQNLTQALSQHASDTFAQAESTLQELAGQISQSGMGNDQLPRLQRIFLEKTQALAQINAISLFDATGRMIVTAANRLPVSTDYSDREYFQYHRDHPQLTVHIGKVIRSRISNDLVLPISRRLNHPDGSFAGVLLESVMINHFRNFYTKFEIDDDSTLMMLLNNGTILYRQPYNEKAIGTTIAGSDLYKENIRQNHAGIVTSSLAADQRQNVYSFTHLKDFPVIITTGLSLDRSLLDWRRDAISQGVITLIFVTLIALTGLLLIRQVRARMHIELELIRTQQELRKLNRSLEKLARSDGLTGLYNRRHFDLTLAHEFNRSLQQHQDLGLILLDVDYFKQFNDLYGHVAGDECLKLIGKTLRELPLRARDLVARYGGEEFIVLLPDTNLAGTLAVAQRIVREVEQLRVPHQGSPTDILTLSIGIFVGVPRADRDTPSKLIVKADAALYQAKHQGRNQICVAG